MTRAEFDDRLRYAGLRKKDLATLLGQKPSHISQLGRTKPVQRYVLSVIAAWEFMSSAKRQEWLAQSEAE
ncbi:MAG: hypothetical protein ACR2OV_15970 [Hyphomicrobiaceae bacterium]